MTQVEKLVSFIEEIFRKAPSDRFIVQNLESGSPYLLDYENRIRIVINVQEIIVTKFDLKNGNKVHEAIVQWEQLSKSQRERIAELVDIPDDLDPEMEETLSNILKGV